MPFEIRGKHLRYRMRRAVKGAKYRVHDVGVKGHTQRLARYNPRTKRWQTQTWMFPVKDIKGRRPRTMQILSDLGIKKRALEKVL